MWIRASRALSAADRAGGGVWLDLALYGLSALFAGVTALTSTLPPHRAWGAIAAVGYAGATALAAGQLVLRRRAALAPAAGPWARGILATLTWVATALVPLVLLAAQRAGGRTDRAQEEILVVEAGGARLWHTGSPYLDRADIAALPPAGRLLGYLPYQPGMALFGTPRALDGAGAWWSDARVWFALATAVGLGAALVTLRRAAPASLVRALQVATVLPICALTLATGGDDLPVLALCLLALALAATGRPAGAGLAIGAAASLKLFSWPVLLVLAVACWRASGPRALARFAAGAVGLPLLTALPILLVGPGAMIENVFAFPLGRGLVHSPAASPLPGHLIATLVPGGRPLALALLLGAAVALLVQLARRPPATIAGAAVLSGVWLLVATLLLPATRFGYLLYPAALLVWAPALRSAATRHSEVDAEAPVLRSGVADAPG